MAARLTLHGKSITSVFELLGDRENDITASIGWALAKCPTLCRRVVHAAIPGVTDPDITDVRLQHWGEDGVTDIELNGHGVHVIIEAKRGFELPGDEQMARYSARLAKSEAAERALLTVSQASALFAQAQPRDRVAGLPCRHLSLRDLAALVRASGGSHAEKRLLTELEVYLNKVARMQDITSNMVYVVSLSQNRPPDSDITWCDIVEKHGRYFHPVGGSYPREPANYLGFRHGGRLQSIRHTRQCEVVRDLGTTIPGCRFKLDGPHYLYTLGPPIIPSKTVRNGRVAMANRVYAAIDLLLTCDTISEAGEQTRARMNSL